MHYSFGGIFRKEVPDSANPPELEYHRFTNVRYLRRQTESLVKQESKISHRCCWLNVVDTNGDTHGQGLTPIFGLDLQKLSLSIIHLNPFLRHPIMYVVNACLEHADSAWWTLGHSDFLKVKYN